MSDDYTPTDRDVEVAHIENRWLVEHDRQVADKAWALGKVAGKSVTMRRMSDEPDAPEPVNPHAPSTALQGVQEESKA